MYFKILSKKNIKSKIHKIEMYGFTKINLTTIVLILPFHVFFD